MKKSLYETLTTPPPRRPPPPKYPLFTKDPFSTKSFGSGHLVGAGILVLGLYGLTKFFIERAEAEAQRTRRLAEMPIPPRHPVAQADVRGQYGRKP